MARSARVQKLFEEAADLTPGRAEGTSRERLTKRAPSFIGADLLALRRSWLTTYESEGTNRNVSVNWGSGGQDRTVSQEVDLARQILNRLEDSVVPTFRRASRFAAAGARQRRGGPSHSSAEEGSGSPILPLQHYTLPEHEEV